MSDAAQLRIERVAAADVLPLRSLVLRPGVPAEKLVYDGDETPGALHVAARDAAGEIHGIASLCREAAPGRPGVVAWRLRGMATTPAVRGTGAGARLLRACFRHVRAEGGGLLWCNARVVALGFYEHLGLAREGEVFGIAGIGPHYVMSRWLAHLRPATVDEAPLLTSLAIRSKAAAQVGSGTRHHVVASVQHELVGFHAVEPRPPAELRLESLFVEPAWIGRGIGRELFEHAVGVARKLGAARLVALSDPRAGGFYVRMGARQDGDVESVVEPGRRLPRFVLELN